MPHDVPPDVKAAIDRGHKIEAIKLLREATGLGLKEARDAVERIEAGGTPVLPRQAADAAGGDDVARALRQGNKLEAIRLYREQNGVGLKAAKDAVEALAGQTQGDTSGLAPGEVRKSGGVMWIVVAIAAGFLAAYFYFRPD